MKKNLIPALCLVWLSAVFSAADAATDSTLTSNGEYLARAGDCAACHTVPGGKPFAGGLKMVTPMGAIYSTNITPDPETGIGRYSEAQFTQAVRGGVAQDGHRLYPAMPFPSYAKISDEDMHALYTWFMQEVPPVTQANTPSDIPWPLSIRWPLMFWSWTFLEDERYTAVAQQSAQWNRGAYLVQSLGHCGACHTPRGIGFQELGLDQNSNHFLSGAEVDHWFASNLTGNHNTGLGRWDIKDIEDFLRSGANRHATSFGSMTEVVNNSSQYFTEQDLRAVAVYLKSLPGARDDDGTPFQAGTGLTVSLSSNRGHLLYANHCLQCHGVNGQGRAPWLAPLAGNPNVLEPDPSSLINITLNGTPFIVLHGVPSPFPMPGFRAALNNQDVADVVTYLRTAWHKEGSSVTAEQVKRIREVTQGGH